MKGKTGSVRSINNLVVEGSATMIILPWSHRVDNTISVPEFVCRNISIPDISQRFISTCQILGCSCENTWRYMFLSWDVNCTIRISPSMCAPYAADYDGDEMTIFPVKHPLSILEWETFKWDYDLDRMTQHYSNVVSYNQPMIKILFHTMSVCTTLS